MLVSGLYFLLYLLASFQFQGSRAQHSPKHPARREAMASWAEQLERELTGRGLAVASVPGKGRGLVATRSFFPGNPTRPPSPSPNPTLLFAPRRRALAHEPFDEMPSGTRSR
jgi:hypothetical protein